MSGSLLVVHVHVRVKPGGEEARSAKLVNLSPDDAGW